MDNRKTRARGAVSRIVAAVVTFAAAIVFSSAHASFHTWRIAELYTDAGGNAQFVELHETFSSDFEDLFMGQHLTSRQGAATRVYTFPTNLPSTATAGKRLLIGTAGFAAVSPVAPDFIVPAPFLFPGGGTLDYAGVDSFTYPALPIDGLKSLDRDGSTGINSPTNFAGQSGSVGAPGGGNPAPPGQGIPALGYAAFLVLTLALGLLGARRAALRRR